MDSSDDSDSVITWPSEVEQCIAMYSRSNKMKEGKVIGSNFLANKINLFKCQDHFDLIRPSEPATTKDRISE